MTTINSWHLEGNDKRCVAFSSSTGYSAAPAVSVPHGQTSARQARHWLACLALMALTCTSCAPIHPEKRPFFLPKQGLETHGRKTWFDRVVEFDPGKTRFQVAADYAQDPPRRIAVLPFIDRGSTNFVVNKIPLSFRDETEQAQWAWSYANRLRRALTGYLAQREFHIVNLLTVDTTLADHGIHNWEALQAVPPQELGRWLNADTVVYGEVLHYEAYYVFLVANWQVGVRMRMVSTHDGHERFVAEGSRYSVDFRPAFTMLDMGINAALTVLQLRDVTLARAEEEISREIVLRLPRAERNVATLIAAARSQRTPDNGYVVKSGPGSLVLSRRQPKRVLSKSTTLLKGTQPREF